VKTGTGRENDEKNCLGSMLFWVSERSGVCLRYTTVSRLRQKDGPQGTEPEDALLAHGKGSRQLLLRAARGREDVLLAREAGGRQMLL
jgi:hypothetical protein